MVKILIIDDDPIVRAALNRTLQKQGYETTVVSNGQEGIAKARLLRPALIICDWMMSQLDGLEVCRQIKADPELATTFFILLTAKGAALGEEEDRVKGLDAGADEFVSKPIDILNILRSQSLPNTSFDQPREVLKALNQAFQMKKHGDKYFTIWYGVYHRGKRQLVYASAGHPPALLLEGTSTTSYQVRQLSSLDLPIGFLPNVNFQDAVFDVEKNSTFYLFSDGTYEINQPNGNVWGLNAFIDLLINYSLVNNCYLQQLLEHIMSLNLKKNLEDDFSLLKISFS